jgi:hypothetical protein
LSLRNCSEKNTHTELKSTVSHFAILFSDRYLAINRVMAEFMPQSLSCAKRFGATTAIASMPISEGDSSLARNMMPNADMIVEIIKP